LKRIYRLRQPLTFFHKILRVLSSVCHFFLMTYPLTFFHKIQFNPVKYCGYFLVSVIFFRWLMTYPLTFFTKYCGLSVLWRHFFSMTHAITAVALSELSSRKRERIMHFSEPEFGSPLGVLFSNHANSASFFHCNNPTHTHPHTLGTAQHGERTATLCATCRAASV
jgi:hypothetical protein